MNPNRDSHTVLNLHAYIQLATQIKTDKSTHTNTDGTSGLFLSPSMVNQNEGPLVRYLYIYNVEVSTLYINISPAY